MNSLKDHPFGVEAFFERSTVLTFAVHKSELEERLPAHLKLDLFEGKWAFIAVALVNTTGLRPAGFPKIFGRDFFLIGVRIFVRYTNKQGKTIRGLYILKSETDSSFMTALGGVFTRYRYTKTDIKFEQKNDVYRIYSEQSNLNIDTSTSNEVVELPDASPFTGWKQARRFAGPLPFTFSFNKKKNQMLIVQGVRSNWKPKPIKILNYSLGYEEILNLNSAVLASAFEITNIPYKWKKGEIEQW